MIFLLLYFLSGPPHLEHFSPSGGCSNPHFLSGQTTVSLALQLKQ